MDGSEDAMPLQIPPTFGVGPDLVIGLIAGGDTAIRKAVEMAEDDEEQGWKDLEAYQPTSLDTIVGIAASGGTPYVIGAVTKARAEGLLTACIVNNRGSLLAQSVDIAIEVIVGPEFVTGSTRMKSGTSQKFILKHDHHLAHDQIGPCERQQNGEHATDQPETHSTVEPA